MTAVWVVLRNTVNLAFRLTRWFAHEFLAIAVGFDTSAIVTSSSRLLGVAVIVAVAHISLSHGVANDVLAATMQFALVGLLAVLLGNIARELAIDIGAGVLRWFGRDFSRKGVMLNGNIYSETLYSDGTWIRCESGSAGTVCEWTDTSGACNRIVTGPPRTTRRDS